MVFRGFLGRRFGGFDEGLGADLRRVLSYFLKPTFELFHNLHFNYRQRLKKLERIFQTFYLNYSCVCLY